MARGEGATVADAGQVAPPWRSPHASAGVDAADRSVVRFCRLDSGARIAYANCGEGPALVMLPGWLSHLRQRWTHPAAGGAREKLARAHRFVWYDRLGCGLSDRDDFAPSLDSDVAQLEAVLDAAHIERATLIGHLVGGPPAAAFAARNPERVERLVLCSTFARGTVMGSAEQMQALRQMVRVHWELGSRMLASMLVPNGSSEDLSWFSRFQRLAARADVAEGLLAHLWRLDVRDLLPEVRAPTLVLHNRNDGAMPLAAAEEVAALVPDARLEVLDGNEHDPLIRDSGAIVEAILAFVDGRPQAASAASCVGDEALTPREHEVLRLMALGTPNKRIAMKLGIAVSTVERHLTHIYGKLGVRGRAAAVMRAVAMGVVRSDGR